MTRLSSSLMEVSQDLQEKKQSKKRSDYDYCDYIVSCHVLLYSLKYREFGKSVDELVFFLYF